jgi:hypothetical protein
MKGDCSMMGDVLPCSVILENKIEKMSNSLAFIIRIYHAVRSSERQTDSIPTIKTMAVGRCCVFPSIFQKEHTTLHKLLHVLFI